MPSMTRGSLLDDVIPSRTTACIASVTLLTLWISMKCTLKWKRRHDLKCLRDKRREHCTRSINIIRQSISNSDFTKTNQDVSIRSLNARELLEKLRQGELQPLDVLRAYQAKALDVHTVTNALTEPILEAENFALNANKDGPLYGLPISIKDDVPIKGYVTTLGVSKFLRHRIKDDCTIVKILKRLGAVPFMRTNIPQLESSYEPGNPIYGTVRNPHDVDRIPGGSSSGEAALISGGGSIVGIGSDIGGSLRVPAHFCGICTLKPTSGRISTSGTNLDYEEQNAIKATWGPMARDVDTVAIMMRSMWENPCLDDPLAVPLTFNDKVFNAENRLKIGYYINNGEFEVVPSCARAVQMAVDKLRELGHEVVEWSIPECHRVTELEFKLFLSDGLSVASSLLEDDVVDDCLRTVRTLLYLPKWARWLAVKIYLAMTWDKHERLLVASALGCPDIETYWSYESELKEFQEIVASRWRAAGLDAVISPSFPFPALKHGTTETSLAGGSYSSAYNVLDFPAGSVPITTVQNKDIEALSSYPVRDKDHKIVKDSMVTSLGLPVGVQVAALKWQDEVCLRVMKDVEQVKDY